MPKLIGIATHEYSKGPITQHAEIAITLQNGLEKDYRGQKDPLKQVTILSKKSWDGVCKEVEMQIDWIERRANLLVDDIDFTPEMIGQKLQIGDVVLQITCETDPCQRMTTLHPQLKQALTPNWNGGARCKVVQAGKIKLGDSLKILGKLSAP